MSQPCLLHQNMLMRASSLSERPFSTIIGGNGGTASMIVVPLARSEHKLQKLRSLDSLDASLTGSSAKSATIRSTRMAGAGTASSVGGGHRLPGKRKSEQMGRCMLCLIINAIFIFGVFIAFLIGHWASSSLTDESLENENITLVNQSLPSWKSINKQMVKEVIINGSAADTSVKVGNGQKSRLFHTDIDRFDSASDRTTAITIFDVYPPLLEDDYGGGADDRSAFNMRLHRFSSADGYDAFPSAAGTAQSHAIVPLPKSLDFSGFETREQIAGNASIYLRSFGNATNAELVFHAAANIFISRIRLHKSYSAESVGVRSVKRDLRYDLVRVILAERLEPNREYKLEVEFRTKICQSDSEGAYCFRATLLERDNRTFVPRITGFVTRFEPRFARTFLPCWDEPRVKATFNVSIVHASHYSMVLSNTASVSQRPVGWDREAFISIDDDDDSVENDATPKAAHFVRTQFEMTPQMSVYLLAFAIGDYTPLEVRTPAANMPLIIWTEPENVIAVHFAANFSPVIFERIQADFNIKYPIGKLDFVVVPSFPVGGMENWGLIIFHARYILSTWAETRTPSQSSSILLSSPGTSSDDGYGRISNSMAVDRASEEYKIEKIITHEIVHQWFGNLVTMYDWEELWLKEGFTSYFVFDLLNEAHPHLTEYEYYQNLIHLFSKQSSVASQALVRRMASMTARQARSEAELFDGVALYTKGAVVVKMLKDLVGTREFHAAITRFLRKFAFQSVDEQALWGCLPDRVDHGAEQERLADIMYSWLYNDGIPEVIISRNYEDQSIRITQEPSNLNRYAVFLNDAIVSNTGGIGTTTTTRRERRSTTGNLSSKRAKHVTMATSEDEWHTIDDSSALDLSNEHTSASDTLSEMLESLFFWHSASDSNQQSNSAVKKKPKRRTLRNDCATDKQKRSCITVRQANDEVDNQTVSTSMTPPSSEKVDSATTGANVTMHHQLKTTVNSLEAHKEPKPEMKHQKQNGEEEAKQRNYQSTRSFVVDSTIDKTSDQMSTTVRQFSTTTTNAPDSAQPTFDDALFSTPNPTKRLRGSSRKRLKNNKRKLQSTRRRFGDNREDARLHSRARDDKIEAGSSATDRPSITDLSRVPIFSADIRSQNRGGNGAAAVSILDDSTVWEGGAARRLASIQTFGMPPRADFGKEVDSAVDSMKAAAAVRQGRARPSATIKKPTTTGSSNNAEEARERRAIWWIPFSYAFGSARSSAGQTVRQFWLRNQTLRFVDVGLDAQQYLLANPHWIYPYRVNYDIDNWQMLIEQLHANHAEIPVMSRVQLIVDGEAFLRFSAAPHLYVRLVSYLAKETELGVLLVGLDAMHSLIDAFSGTRVAGSLTVQLLPAIQQLDRQLAATAAGGTPPEKAALWLLGPLRLAKLYQLRCLCNLGTCAESQQISKWLAHPTALDAEHHQQITAICHFLFAQAGASELTLLAGLLRQRSTQWSVLIQLAGCVRDDELIRTAVEQILRTRNAAVYLSALKSGYSVQYNRRFRESFWSGVADLSLHERQLLFAVNTGRSDRVARQLLHAARTVDELERIEALLPVWPARLRVNLDHLRLKLRWLNGRAAEQLHSFMINDKRVQH